MCKGAVCDTCSQKTWFGCGAHVPSVMDTIPKDQWCKCEPKTEKEGKDYPPMGSMTGAMKAMVGY